jgi:hypothetical protein
MLWRDKGPVANRTHYSRTPNLHSVPVRDRHLYT